MPHLDMARKYTTSEVLAHLEDDEDLSDNEVLAEGSDEEFDDLNELEELEESCQEEWNGLETSEVHKNSSCLSQFIDFDTSMEVHDTNQKESQEVALSLELADTIPTVTSASGLMIGTDALTVSIPLSLLSTSEASSSSTPWTKHLKQPIIHKFAPTIPTGPTIAIPDSPLEIFQQFYTPDLFDYLTYQTNKYAKEILSPEQYSKFEDITRKDILHGLLHSYGNQFLTFLRSVLETRQYSSLCPYCRLYQQKKV